MFFENAYFIIGTSYAGKSTMVKELAAAHGGIACEENYHNALLDGLDAKEFPCVTYTRDLQDWHDFIRRSPQEYRDWIDGAKKECEILELRMLPELCSRGKPVFVDTNISVETLRKITPADHVLVMLADPQISVRRFFERPDPEKQFLYRLILEEPDPEKAMENYRQGLVLINSQESYDELLHSGFKVIFRDENRSVAQTMALAEEAFGLADPFRIGPAAEKDTEEILRLYREQVGREFCFWNETYPGPDTIAFDLSRDSLFVMKDGRGRIIGAVSAETDEDVDRLDCWAPALQPGGEFARLAVSPAFRGRKLARKLVAHILDVLKQRGFRSVHIIVNRDNVSALRTYAHFGFHNAGECEMYDQHFLCYEKAL